MKDGYFQLVGLIMRGRDRAVLMGCLAFVYGGSFNPTNIRATVGNSGTDVTRAVGNFSPKSALLQSLLRRQRKVSYLYHAAL